MKTILAFLLLVAAAQAAAWANPKQLTRKRPHVPRNRSPIISERIIDGELATVGQIKYQVAVIDEFAYLYGGSLIADDIILTAADSVFGSAYWDVVAGALDYRNRSEPGSVFITSTKGLMHEGFDDFSLKNNIGLIFLGKPISGPNIAPIRLPSRSQEADMFVGVTARMSGYGYTSDIQPTNNRELRFIDVTIMENNFCSISCQNNLNEGEMCAESEKGRVPHGGGDVGSPLVITESDGLPTQVGIVSYQGYACPNSIPSALIRVTSFLDWIETNAGVTIRP